MQTERFWNSRIATLSFSFLVPQRTRREENVSLPFLSPSCCHVNFSGGEKGGRILEPNAFVLSSRQPGQKGGTVQKITKLALFSSSLIKQLSAPLYHSQLCSATLDKPSASISLSLSLCFSLPRRIPCRSLSTKEYNVKGFRGDKEYRFIIRVQYGRKRRRRQQIRREKRETLTNKRQPTLFFHSLSLSLFPSSRADKFVTKIGGAKRNNPIVKVIEQRARDNNKEFIPSPL